jgi:hypothetical protein
MSAARLDSLTNELFENMVECLDLNDLRNLRMVSKAVAFKTTQNHFASYFSRKKVDLTRPGLQAFVRETSQGTRLGCRVRHLTLTRVEYCISELEKVLESGEVVTDTRLGSHHDPKRRACRTEELHGLQSSLDKLRQCQADGEDFHRQGLDVSLLSEAFQNIASHKGPGVETLRLEVVARIDGIGNRRPAGALGMQNRAFGLGTAARAFSIVAASSRDNGPIVQRLELFTADPASTWCSLPYDTFSHFDWEASESWPSLRAVKKLSMRVSDRFTEIPELDSTHLEGCTSVNGGIPRRPATLKAAQRSVVEREREIDTRHRENITRMQQLCRHLEELDITWYRLSWLNPRFFFETFDPNLDIDAIAQWKSRQSYMHRLSQSEPFPNLRKLQLGGLSLSIDDLLAFVRKHNASLREISLENVQAVDSLFAPLFEFLASQDCAVERVHLKDLQEDLRSLFYLPEQESQFTKLSGATRQRDNVIDRWGVDVKLVIRCYPRTTRWRNIENKEVCRANRWKEIAFGSVHAGIPCWKV